MGAKGSEFGKIRNKGNKDCGAIIKGGEFIED
jgi:hypothetical protein